MSLWDLDLPPPSNAHQSRLRRAREMSRGGSPVPHAELRMLEKKKLLVIYRLRDGSELPVLTAKGRQALGLTGFEDE